MREFVLHYQPKVELRERPHRQRRSARALESSAAGHASSPAQFIPLAEETGLILPIGTWVLREACRQGFSAWQDAGLTHLRVAVNLSAQQFREKNLLEIVRGALADAHSNRATWSSSSQKLRSCRTPASIRRDSALAERTRRAHLGG